MPVLIFGKDGCPYTQAAVDDYRRRGHEVDYIRVTASRADLERMLVHSKGKRRVPVIVDEGKVTIGFGGT
jgi:glutaredoxin 3